VLLVVAVGAALAVAGVVLPRRSTLVRTYAEPLNRVVVRLGAGKVTLVADRQLGARVSTVRRYSLRKPSITSNVENGVLSVAGACPKPTIVTCRIDVRVGISPETAVDVTTGSGDVRVENVAGSVRVRTSAGAVDIIGLTGTADILTSAGPISGQGLAVTRLRAGTAAGAIGLAFAVAPDSVSASTGAGDVDVALPEESYRVTTSAPAGHARVLVPVEADATRTVAVHTAAGRITVRRAPPM
jgi:hypothetical protein